MRTRILVLATVAVLALGLAWAGGEGQAGKMASPAEHAAKLKAKLGLSDAQAEQVRALFEDIDRRIAELKASGPDAAAIQEGKKKLKEERIARLKSILTAEQYARYEQMQAEHAARGKQKP